MRKSVSRKMWGGFGAILLLLIIVGALSLWITIDVNQKYEMLLQDEVKKVDLVNEFILKQKEIQSEVRGYMLYKDEQFLTNRETYLERSDALIQELGSIISGDQMQTHFEALQESNKAFVELQDVIVSNTKAGKDGLAITIGKSSSNVGNIVLDRAEMIKQVQYDSMDKKLVEIEERMFGTIIFSVSLIGLSVIIGLTISTFISRSISRPVQVVTDGLDAIAKGDFSIDPLVVKNKDEIGLMASAFNKMGADVANMIRRINDSSMQLAAQSEQLSASSEESLASSEIVSQTAERQFASSEQQKQITEQTASSMNELTIGVSEIAANNEQMLQSAEQASQLVVRGSQTIMGVSDQMNTIHATIHESSAIMEEMAMHSSEIQKITTLITSIADQTNLLALNAAIEAARAGEHGKGFAVVAEEVRHLAEQSKSSAAEIGKMVERIQHASTRAVQSISSGSERVDAGIEASKQSNTVFNEIQSSVGDVVAKIETVSAAIEQIQAMAEEVMNGSSEIRTLSLQTTSTASETSAATIEQLAVSHEISASAQSLAKLAEDLQHELQHFKV